MISRPSHKLFLSNFSLTCFNTQVHKEIFEVKINFDWAQTVYVTQDLKGQTQYLDSKDL